MPSWLQTLEDWVLIGAAHLVATKNCLNKLAFKFWLSMHGVLCKHKKHNLGNPCPNIPISYPFVSSNPPLNNVEATSLPLAALAAKV